MYYPHGKSTGHRSPPLNYDKPLLFGSLVPAGRGNRNSVSSPRVNGRLILQDNRYSLVRDVTTNYRPGLLPDGTPFSATVAWGVVLNPVPYTDRVSMSNACYAKGVGKLNKGSADLLLNAAQFRENRSMIVERLKHVRRSLDTALALYGGSKSARARFMREREPVANKVLELDFGWQPLIEDLGNALSSLIQDGVPPFKIRATEVRQFSRGQPGDKQVTADGGGFVGPEIGYYQNGLNSPDWVSDLVIWRLTWDFTVMVENPNLHLAQRTGFLNPIVSAWDAVPWSFVVNWFINFDQMIRSLSDFAGLKVTDSVYTFKTRTLRAHDKDPYRYSSTIKCQQTASSVVVQKTVERVVGQLAPVVAPRAPRFDTSLCRIASALVVQRFNKLNRLLRI